MIFIFYLFIFSRRPRKANLSKNLIALLSVGGVPKEYFLGLLETTLQEAQKVSSSMRATVRCIFLSYLIEFTIVLASQ